MKRFISLLNIVLILSLGLAACAPTPEVVEKVVKETVVVEKEIVVEVEVTKVVEVEKEVVVEVVVTATPTPTVEPTEADFVKGELLVIVNTRQYPGFPADPEELKAFLQAQGVELIEPEPEFPEGFQIPGLTAQDETGEIVEEYGTPRLFHLRITDGMTEMAKVRQFRNLGKGVYADLNYLCECMDIPDEWWFRLGDQWNFHNSGPPTFPAGYVADVDIDAPEMWELRVSCNGVIVALLDTGHDDGGTLNNFWGRPDLGLGPAAPPYNLWVDPAEDPDRDKMFNLVFDNDFRDADGDFLVDDVVGWDFGDGDNNPRDTDGHGTNVGSLIAALANNNRVAGDDWDIAGTCWKGRLMILKVTRDGFEIEKFDLWAVLGAYLYAVQHHAQILNCSFGREAFSTIEFLILAGIDFANTLALGGWKQCLVVAAAGNYAQPNNGPRALYPASYNLPDLIISVGALKWNNRKAAFSNHGIFPGKGLGQRGVDILAPGVDIPYHKLGPGVGFGNGTSLAAPQVSGVAALIWAENPQLSSVEVKRVIVDNADCRNIWDDPPGKALSPFTIPSLDCNDTCLLNGFKALASQVPPEQLLPILCEQLFSLPADWDITTLKEVLIKALDRAHGDGLLSSNETDEAIKEVKTLPDTIPYEGLEVNRFPNLNQAVDKVVATPTPTP